MREDEAGGADATRLHGLRGERSNVPRKARYFTERGKTYSHSNCGLQPLSLNNRLL